MCFRKMSPIIKGSCFVSMPSGQQWRFHHWIYQNNDTIDDYQEFSSVLYSYTRGNSHAVTGLSNGNSYTYDAMAI